MQHGLCDALSIAAEGRAIACDTESDIPANPYLAVNSFLCVLTTEQNKLSDLCLARFWAGLWRGKGALGGVYKLIHYICGFFSRAA